MRSVQRNEEGEGLSQIEVCIYIALRCVSSIRHMRVAAQHAASPLYKGCRGPASRSWMAGRHRCTRPSYCDAQYESKIFHVELNSTRGSVHRVTFVHALPEKYLPPVKEEFTAALLHPPAGDLPTAKRNQISRWLQGYLHQPPRASRQIYQ